VFAFAFQCIYEGECVDGLVVDMLDKLHDIVVPFRALRLN